jgi:tetratricopeptide (TPR) repeat protein
VRIEVDGNRLEDAKETLAKLVEMVPADARVLSAKADLLEAQGKLREARALRQDLVRRRPHWTRTVDLAILEFHMGESESARRRLSDLLKVQPNNAYAKENLAAIEIVFGDPKRAAEIYQELIAVRPTALCRANLGFARFVLGDYPAAESAFRQALVLNPDYSLTRFNLAAVLDARGDPAGAQRLCRPLVKEFEAEPTQGDPILGLLYAQCLVRLGRNDDATLLTDQVLDKWPEEKVQILFRAAQLYALLGKRRPALYYIEKTLEKGLRREWFTFPEFRTLKNDPEFRALLESATPPQEQNSFRRPLS